MHGPDVFPRLAALERPIIWGTCTTCGRVVYTTYSTPLPQGLRMPPGAWHRTHLGRGVFGNTGTCEACLNRCHHDNGCPEPTEDADYAKP